ncbi:hypothetical protein MU1_30460 [Paenibacillus glycanilyticus]|uniref:Uncharacterized protein n=1 Tax=Paenibacillus glycanilyticus TaxID=126569 RepID=A0ABQ6GCL2_9BACL|nr:hypothetical protein MU1_30460 [Paenibacillus glycanilyticus]
MNDLKYAFEVDFVIIYIYVLLISGLYFVVVRFVQLRKYSWQVIRKSLIRCMGIFVFISLTKYLLKYGFTPLTEANLDGWFFASPLGIATSYLFADTAISHLKKG